MSRLGRLPVSMQGVQRPPAFAPGCWSGTVFWHDRRRITDAVRTKPRVVHVPSLWADIQPRGDDEAEQAQASQHATPSDARYPESDPEEECQAHPDPAKP
jgi:hypothetical protein